MVLAADVDGTKRRGRSYRAVAREKLGDTGPRKSPITQQAQAPLHRVSEEQGAIVQEEASWWWCPLELE